MRPILLLMLAVLFGCGPTSELVYLQDIPQPPPAADLPRDLRMHNWIGTDEDGQRGGSCAHASTRMVFRAGGEYRLDQIWAENASRGYEGPESADRLLEKLNAQGILFAATEDGDAELLEAASRTGRWATIFYYPSHSICFCGFAEVNGQMSALLMDNNFPDYYIVVEKQFFLQSWKNAYGGFAVVPWIMPNVPRTFPRTFEREIVYAR